MENNTKIYNYRLLGGNQLMRTLILVRKLRISPARSLWTRLTCFCPWKSDRHQEQPHKHVCRTVLISRGIFRGRSEDGPRHSTSELVCRFKTLWAKNAARTKGSLRRQLLDSVPRGAPLPVVTPPVHVIFICGLYGKWCDGKKTALLARSHAAVLCLPGGGRKPIWDWAGYDYTIVFPVIRFFWFHCRSLKFVRETTARGTKRFGE